MALAPLAQRPPDGDYVVTRAHDTAEERADAEQTLRANGCLRFWHTTLADGRLQAHGYMRAA
jgi:hypothetical protein